MVLSALKWTSDFPPSAWRTWAKDWLRGDPSARSHARLLGAEKLARASVRRFVMMYHAEHPKTWRAVSRQVAVRAARSLNDSLASGDSAQNIGHLGRFSVRTSFQNIIDKLDSEKGAT